MVVFPPCKINLGLHVISRRSDGYHNIESCFYPVPWTDVLEIVISKEPAFTLSGIPIAGDSENNLCVKAMNLMTSREGIGAVHMHLHKILPSGAGLGGGSSDAAHTLTVLNALFGLNLSADKLRGYAAELGSDCPFFLDPRPTIGTGRGEVLTPTTVSLRGKFLVVVHPGIPIATAEAYRAVTPRQPETTLNSILERDPAEWKKLLGNDFEESAFQKHPQLRAIKEALYRKGAIYASMSGSGSAIFGLFDRPVEVKNDFPDYTAWSGTLTT